MHAFIIDALRTPIGKYAGALASIRPDDLASIALRALLERNPSIDPDLIDDVILGCANQAGEDNRNIARMSLLLAGLPPSVPGMTVNRLCASGMSATLAAANAIIAGDGHIFLAGGVESMTRAPFVLPKADKSFSRTHEIFDTTLGWRFVNHRLKELYGVDTMGETAENVAEQFQVSRTDQDHFAFLSQKKAAAAQERGAFANEIIPVSVNTGKSNNSVARDEFLRPDTTFEALQALKPAFRFDGKGSVTAGNSSGINDGACTLLLASEDAVQRFQLQPRARIICGAASGVQPRIMGLGPVEATKKAFAKSRLTSADMDVIEINEAFAAQCLACLRELKIADDDPRVNPQGGGIALGHPLGMSGARLITTALYQLEETKKHRALCTMCVGVGQGVSCIIERL